MKPKVVEREGEAVLDHVHVREGLGLELWLEVWEGVDVLVLVME